MKAIHKARERLNPPTQAEMARRLGVAPQQVNLWFKRGYAAPRYAPAIERITGVSCSELVADISRKNKH